VKPADFGISEPANPDAFATIAASLGFTTVQTSARQQVSVAASIGRIEGAPGNVLPLQALNAAARAALGQAVGAETGPALPHDGVSAVPRDGAADAQLDVDWFASGRFAAAVQASSTGSRAGRLPMLDPWLPPQGADGFPIQLMNVSENSPDGALSALRQVPAMAGEPVATSGGPIALSGAPISTVVTAEAPLPLHHPRFVGAFSQQVTMMARDGVQHARITVNPPELGPVELRIVLRNDEATVHFAAQHAAVRDALEDAMPRLREQFEQAGLRLHDGAVFDQLPQRSPEQGNELAEAGDTLSFDESADESLVQGGAPIVRHGLIDAYA
jgi:hypothetical protein